MVSTTATVEPRSSPALSSLTIYELRAWIRWCTRARHASGSCSTAPVGLASEPGEQGFREAHLEVRYPKVREPILVALHILTQNPDISLDDAKAQAALHGTRITAASVAGARRLLSRQDGEDEFSATTSYIHIIPVPSINTSISIMVT